MSKRSWVFAVSLGLIALPGLGQSQGEAQNEQVQTTTQQEPAQTTPFSIPIQIVEDDAAAEARERREAETRQHDKDDLIAQQGMNAATQAMNEATQRMAEYAFWSTLAIWIGTILLIGTLVLAVLTNTLAFNHLMNRSRSLLMSSHST